MAAGAARNLALTAAGRKALRQTDGFVGKILVWLGSTSAGARHAAVGWLEPQRRPLVARLRRSSGLLSALAAAAPRGRDARDARLRRYVLSIFANLAADPVTRRTLGMAGSSAPTVLPSIARGFVSARPGASTPSRRFAFLESLTSLFESLTSLAADADADATTANESTGGRRRRRCRRQGRRERPGVVDPEGSGSRAQFRGELEAFETLVTRVASLGAGMAGVDVTDAAGTLFEEVARLARRTTPTSPSQATTGTSNAGPRSSNDGEGFVAISVARGSSNRASERIDRLVEQGRRVDPVAGGGRAAIPERAASVQALQLFEAGQLCARHAAVAVLEREAASGGDAVIGCADDAAYDLG